MRASFFERVLDSDAWVIAERAFRAHRERPIRRAPAPRAPATDLERALEALDAALAVGAVETAATESERVLGELRSASSAGLRSRAIAAAIEVRIALGDRDGAASLAHEHASTLERTARGVTVLDLLGARDATSYWLPDGRANAVAIARDVERGRLDADGVLATMVRRPTVLLRDPQLHLLVANATGEREGARTARALTRVLRAYGLPGVAHAHRSHDLLESLAFEPGAPTHDGPLVSIVVSAYRAERTIRHAMDSLLAQSHRAIEILACDDASDDGTWSILRERYGDDPRVRLFRSRANQGTYNIRNALLERARGELLTFHDADDVAHPARIARQVATLRRTGAESCTTSCVRIDPDGRAVFFRDQSAVRLAVVSLMTTRSAYEAVGPFRRARFGADLELLEDLRLRAPIARDRAPLLLVAWSSTSMTRSAAAQSLEDGYRSPARRAYAELARAKRRGEITSTELDARLRAMGNYAEPSGVDEHRAHGRTA
ncbi:Hypothetical protein I5071_89870 [Sandaracinus amylolyticus]|nr:Hypothetical protein I5071_89870 [Sandaracinus amylolyticus]